MKKVVLLLILIGMMFVSAVDEPSIDSIGGEDVKKIQGAIEDLPIDPETGEIDYDKYKPFQTKAEERIAEINLWLETNASWLKVVFGMVPSLTWLFGINLLLWLWFFIFLVLNADIILGQLPFFGKEEIDLVIFETSWAQIFGLFVFGAVVALKWIADLTSIVHGLFDVLWNIILPMGFAITAIAAVLIVAGCGFSIPLAMRIAETIRIALAARKKKKEEEEEALNREVLGNIVEGATEGP